MAHTEATSAALIARVRRITGQLHAVERLLEEGASCSAILQQIAGARGAINGLLDEVVEDHLREHVVRPELDAAARAAGAEELMAVIRRYSK